MGAGHHHDHDHAHALDLEAAANRRRLIIVLALTLLYMFAEVVGGYLTGSLALLADAGHMLSDAGSLALSFFALWLARRPPDTARTFGYSRVEILAALVHAVTLFAVAGFVVVEALERLSSPPEVTGPLMLVVAAGGLVVNLIGLAVLHGGQAGSLNIRGAWLHVLTDALGSVGVLVSAGLIWGFGFNLADPIASLLISVLVAGSAVPLFKQSVAILMEGAPRHIDVEEVKEALCEVVGVDDVHDLHVWTISQGRDCVAGHVVVDPDRDHQNILQELRHTLAERFGVDHVTLQLEDRACEPHQVCS